MDFPVATLVDLPDKVVHFHINEDDPQIQRFKTIMGRDPLRLERPGSDDTST